MLILWISGSQTLGKVTKSWELARDSENPTRHSTLSNKAKGTLNPIDLTVLWIIQPPTLFVWTDLDLAPVQAILIFLYFPFLLRYLNFKFWSEKIYIFLYCISTVFIFHVLNFLTLSHFWGTFSKKLVWKNDSLDQVYWVIIHNILVVSIKKSDEYK